MLQSQGIKSETLTTEGRYQLLVAEEDVASARRELLTYNQENKNWQPRQPRVKFDYQNPLAGILGFVLVMLFVTWTAGENFGGLNWFTAGKVDAGLVRGGEWWRTITALTLHADIAHLSGNLVFGAVFGFFAGQYFGPGVAWLSILIAGATGNWFNSYLQSSTHTSVGASTAIFGALGLVAAFSWKRKLYPQDRWAYRLGPVIGGIALLAFTGTGGERTDVSAHLTGFVCGFLIGAVFAICPYNVPRSAALQWIAGLSSITAIIFSWAMALN
ncbi:MAG: rhomboid family intramembrane serine protease [Gammaproteobacteria bacterium]|nr:rhomboid family intramembrane serine protease [Gammaproteobacteria bacterium]